MKKNKQLLITVTVILIILLVTLGASFAFFSFAQNGLTENSIKLGSITFKYTENGNLGNGISIGNAFPISDDEGKSQNETGSVFDFKIESSSSVSDLEYEIVAQPTEDSTLPLDAIKFYLTNVNDETEVEIDNTINSQGKVKTLDEYNDTLIKNTIGKTIYQETILKGTKGYVKEFRARMWINEEIDWSDENYLEKSGAIKINVYVNNDRELASTESTLSALVLKNNKLIEAEPTLTTSSNNTTDVSGLYKSTATNFNGVEGKPTYYFRGNVENNYVDFAGFTWRIVRINEDGTVRLVMTEGINNNATYAFINTGSYTNYLDMYYSRSNAKVQLETWYNSKLSNYSNYIATGNYFCEQANVTFDSTATSGNAEMILYTSYEPNFKCVTDGNNYGVVNSNIGLLSYDEIVYAGAYYSQANDSYYLYNGSNNQWLMSPAGITSTTRAWNMYPNGSINVPYVGGVTSVLHPVINLKADTVMVGSGTSTDPYAIPESFGDKILADNTLIEAAPTLTNSYDNSTDASGLYKSTATNFNGVEGTPTYYFRGAVTNNYVDFAGFTWRIVRINEDGTIRLVMQDGINNDTLYVYNSNYTAGTSLYYSNSNAKTQLETWYNTNLIQYSNYIANGNYYCEQAKVKNQSGWSSASSAVVYYNYTSNFKCDDDSNGYGLVSSNIGLLNYDEVVHAGAYFGVNTKKYYLYSDSNTLDVTMSPDAFDGSYIRMIYMYEYLGSGYSHSGYALRPVINLKADTMITGRGTSTNPYKVQ